MSESFAVICDWLESTSVRRPASIPSARVCSAEIALALTTSAADARTISASNCDCRSSTSLPTRDCRARMSESLPVTCA